MTPEHNLEYKCSLCPMDSCYKKSKNKACCALMKNALTTGYSWARQLEVDKDGDIYIWTYATDETPYKKQKVKIMYCPFCGKRVN